ncbi:MAG: hypothetical protein IT532_05850 [Burkholderiales bacterium]|nr:hypothetical protein [Burkholderiales bacterium]
MPCPAARMLIAMIASVTLLADASGQEQDDQTPKGVNPKDNITKIDLIYSREAFEGDVRIHSLSFRFDRALDARWGANIELPLLRFEAPGLTESGMGDAQFRLRYVNSQGLLAYIAAAELIAPTAGDDVLGSGKWQVNPVVGAVLALSQTAFVYAGYKHIWSIAGDNDRPDIDQSQPRLLAAITSHKGWWVLGDLKYTRDHEARTNLLDMEAEAGTMLSPSMAIAARVGTSALDSTRDSKLSVNFRYIFR